MQSPLWRTIRISTPPSSFSSPPLHLLSPVLSFHLQNLLSHAMSSPSLTNTAILISHSLSPDTLPSNVITPGWTSHLFFPTEYTELWLSKHTLPPSSSAFPTLSPLSISPSVVTSSPPPTIGISSILSINIPIHCHCLCSFPSSTKHSTLITTIMDLYFAVPFNQYFNDGCLFEALYKAYLQVECLDVIVNTLFTTRMLHFAPILLFLGLIFSFLMITHPPHVISLLTTLVFVIASFHPLLWTSMTHSCLLVYTFL